MQPVNQKRGVVVTHGGAGSTRDAIDGCEAAGRLALQQLRTSGSSLDAVVAAVVSLEDDSRFNAGTGSHLGLDGKTVELDAAVMDTRGKLGAVACLGAIRNPIRVARAVADTPNWLLAGEGAQKFAQLMKLDEPLTITEQSREQHRRMLMQLAEPGSEQLAPGYANDQFKRFWNYSMSWEQALLTYGCGTVGAVARDAQGHFAVATSTGGSPPSLNGRVGDTPVIGCGFYAGPKGAIAATGVGEYIVRQMLARTVYSWIERGEALESALQRGVHLFSSDVDVGLIGVTETEATAASNRDMPFSVVTELEAAALTPSEFA
ncbi:MAG TPA: isoaspartyl peptidase/L-asparaginase [Burkholderiaceae bacterium]|jgi:L-asparaginase/beta-aspartyl-peptidase (threonine type)|nr:isoaspartyl peptidase/L-asparaginase [Burkholderiaceae bacterium]